MYAAIGYSNASSTTRNPTLPAVVGGREQPQLPDFRDAIWDAGACDVIVSVLGESEQPHCDSANADDNDPEIVGKVLHTLRFLVRSVVVRINALLERDCMRLLLSAMQRYVHHEEVQCWGCGAINDLTYSSSNSGWWEAHALQAVGAIRAAVSAHPVSPEVANHACGAIRNIAFSTNLDTVCGAAGGVDVVACAFLAHAGNKSVLRMACHALQNLTCHCVANQELCAFGGLIQSVLGVLHRHMADPELAHLLVARLKDVVGVRPGAQLIACEHGALNKLLAVLRAHPGDSKCAGAVAATLVGLLGSVDELKQEWGSSGGVELLVDALRRHLDRAVARTTAGSSGGVAEAEAAVDDLGAAASVLAALIHLSTHPELRASVRQCGGPGVVVSVLRHYNNIGNRAQHSAPVDVAKATARTVQRACTMIANLAGRRDNRDLIQLGVPAELVSALNVHREHDEVVKTACRAVRRLCGSAADRATLVQKGALMAAVGGMRAHATEGKVVESACGAVRLLTYIRESMEWCISMNVTADLVAALNAHPENPKLVEHASRALWHLKGSSRFVAQFHDAEGVEVLAKAMLHHRGVTALLDRCNSLLKHVLPPEIFNQA